MQAHSHHLEHQGNSVCAMGFTDAYSDLDAEAWLPAKVRTFKPWLSKFGYAPSLSSALLTGSFDIVHQHGLWLYPSIATTTWRRRRMRPVVISVQGMLEPWALSNSLYKKRLATLLFEGNNLSQASCLHCSDAEVEGVRRFGLKNPIAVLPNGIDLPTVKRRENTTSSVRPTDNRKILLFLGRLHPKKGLSQAIEAWGRVKNLKPEIAKNWQFVIAGWGEDSYLKQLKTIVAARSLDGDIFFLGPVFGKRKEQLLSNADAFVLPSFSEGLPIAVLEAWSYALPTFITPECNLRESFKLGASFELTTDPQRMAQTLADKLISTELLQVGIRARQMVEQRYSWPPIVDDLFSVYRWLVGRGVRPSCVFMD